MDGFTRDLKQLVWLRDGGHCQRCWASVWQGDIHHRRPRGMGGRDGRETWINHHSNLVLLCRSCHDFLEEHPIEARRTGYRLDHGQVPEEVPIYCGDGVWYLLHGDDYKTPDAAPHPFWV